MAKRVLIAELVLFTVMVLGLVVKEIPGMVREYRIWRMAGRRLPRRG
ncbi:hypothetical protein [Streptomyces sp. YIM 98790]|nr:hypothetical protein [Streptomyces sp. YIM 98790]